jgi:exosortase
MRLARRLGVSLGILGGSFAVLFGGILASLANDWRQDDNYSHGYFIIPLALYFVWERRAQLTSTPLKPHWSGLAIVVASLALVVGGVLGVERFTARFAMLGAVGGSVVFLLGWRHLKLLAFPLVFLLLMIPIPSIIFNQIAFPLQLVASRFGETCLAMLNIPVLREGNVIFLAHTTLEVAEACSGIRSLVSLLTLAIVYGYFADRRASVRLAVALSAVPVAIFTNGLRVAGTGVAAHYWGSDAATGFLHAFSGWLVFGASLGILFAAIRIIVWITPRRISSTSVPQTEYV